MKIKNEKIISDSDWDELVQKTYNRPYKFQQQDGCKDRGFFRFSVPNAETYDFENDSIIEEVNGPEMGVSFKAWLARDPKAPLKGQKYKDGEGWERDLWWQRNFYPDFQIVANDLCAKGLIEPGNYIIEIDW